MADREEITQSDDQHSGDDAPRLPDPEVALRNAHAHAVAELESQRKQSGQLSTGINRDVGESILQAGVLALSASGLDEPRQFVVAAPPGTGKTSHAIALMAATIRTADNNPSKSIGCLFVVDQIMKADDMFRQINALLPGQVAVWSSDHDVDCRKPTKLWVRPEQRFHVDELEQHPIVVVTQAFIRGPRGHKARGVVRGEHKVPRALTIFDEQTKEVEVYDIRLSQAIKVKEELEKDERWAPVVKVTMQPLLDFMWRKAKQTGNAIETPLDDPEGWRAAREQLEWFVSEAAEDLVRSNSREISGVDEVFGFGAQLHNNCAFIFRHGGGENGTNFMAYVPVPTPETNSVLLDATADIDGVSTLCSWRTPVSVPSVRYDNLHIIHAEPYTRENLTDFFRSERNRRNYARHATKLITDIMPAGARGLVVCKKTLVDHRHLPAWRTDDPRFSDIDEFVTKYGWDLEGRHLAVTWWAGHGIGANDWKNSDFVFQLGEYILPRRTLIAMVQGFHKAKATTGVLAASRTANTRAPEVDIAREGHLLRFMKQMGMRGRARAFDQQGLCGRQVLVLTCDFTRLLINAHKLFPGATLSKWGRTQERFATLTQPEKLLEVLTDLDVSESISGDEMARRLGAERWRAVSTNALTETVRKALANIGWSYVPGRGPKAVSMFVKDAVGALTPLAWNEGLHWSRYDTMEYYKCLRKQS
jgi:hypothetical protein